MSTPVSVTFAVGHDRARRVAHRADDGRGIELRQRWRGGQNHEQRTRNTESHLMHLNCRSHDLGTRYRPGATAATNECNNLVTGRGSTTEQRIRGHRGSLSERVCRTSPTRAAHADPWSRDADHADPWSQDADHADLHSRRRRFTHIAENCHEPVHTAPEGSPAVARFRATIRGRRHSMAVRRQLNVEQEIVETKTRIASDTPHVQQASISRRYRPDTTAATSACNKLVTPAGGSVTCGSRIIAHTRARIT